MLDRTGATNFLIAKGAQDHMTDSQKAPEVRELLRLASPLCHAKMSGNIMKVQKNRLTLSHILEDTHALTFVLLCRMHCSRQMTSPGQCSSLKLLSAFPKAELPGRTASPLLLLGSYLVD